MKSATDFNTFNCEKKERLVLDPDPNFCFLGLTSQKSSGIRIRLTFQQLKHLRTDLKKNVASDSIFSYFCLLCKCNLRQYQKFFEYADDIHSRL